MMLKGEIEILIRDSETMEVIERIIQPNIVTYQSLDQLVTDSADAFIKGSIVAVSLPMSPSRSQVYIPGDVPSSNTSVVGVAIPGNGAPDYFPGIDGSTPSFAQWSTRLPLPPVTRTISTVLLTNVSGQDWLTNYYSNYSNRIFAYSRLATPCTQTPTQFFDIYYRIYFPLTNQHDMPIWQYDAMIKRMTGLVDALWQGNNGNYRIYASSTSGALPMVTANPGDEGICWPSWTGTSGGVGGSIVTSSYWRKKYSQSFALTAVPGLMMSTLYFFPGNGVGVTGFIPIDIGTKIQNLLGHRSTSQMPFLDVSNFQQGTGSLTLGGNWDNRGAPLSTGLHASGKFSSMYFIKIASSGAVGAATYIYASRPFFGVWSNVGPQGAFPGNLGTWKQEVQELPFISQSLRTGGPAANPEMGNTLLGDMSKCGIRQLSSWCKYDDTSIVIVKQDQIIIYNIATGKYLSFVDSFTDVRQVCVIGTKIYLSCFNTGLYMIDPINSNVVTAIPSATGGIDLSTTHGVVKGYNNLLWVAGNNCLASYDGSTWTKYESTTAIPFNSPGISDGKWNNIEYLVADDENPNNQLFIVRRYDASVNATSLGVWWSTIGSATNMGNEGSSSGTSGSPRLNRTHVAGKGGIWITLHNNVYSKMSFGVTTFSTNVTSPSLNAVFNSYSSIMFIKNASNITRWLNLYNTGYTQESDYNGTSFNHPIIKLYDTNFVVEASITSAMSAGGYYSSLSGTLISQMQSSNIYTTNNGDLTVSFPLANGVLFSAGFHTELPAQGIYPDFRAFLGVYPFDTTTAGGALAYLGETSYGWDGSNWTTVVSTPKTIHTSTDALDSGVTLSFTDGSGTSFVIGDWYNFVTCEGLQKDSATTGAFEYAFYYKRAYRDQTELSSGTIPVTASLESGTAGLDLARSSSSDITFDGNQFIFDGANPQQFAVGDRQVTGNFNVSYAFSPSTWGTNAKYIAFGIGHASTGQILYGFVIQNDVIFVCDTPNDYAGVMSYSGLRSGGWGNFTATHRAINGVPGCLYLLRTGGILQFWKRIATDLLNPTRVEFVDTLLWTCTTLPLGQLRWDLIMSPYNDYTVANWTQYRTCPMVSVASGSDNAVRIGNLVDTGSYNPLFYAIDGDTRNTNIVLIDGVPAIAYHYNGALPGPTEVTIDPFMGTLHFNPADEGKTVSATYTYMTHE